MNESDNGEHFDRHIYNTLDSILRKVCLLELLRKALKRKKFHLA